MSSEQTRLDSTSASSSSASGSSVDHFVQQKYKHGFVTDIESETVPPGLDEDVVRWISARKEEPQWLLDWRLKAYRQGKPWRQAPAEGITASVLLPDR